MSYHVGASAVNEPYEQWVIPNCPQKVWVILLRHIDFNLDLFLQGQSDDSAVLRVRYSNPVAYRQVAESYANTAPPHIGLWTTTESHWLNSLRTESGELLTALESLNEKTLRHYHIVTEDNVVNVAAFDHPDFRWFDVEQVNVMTEHCNV